MRDINRIDPFLQKLGGLWKLLPDYRFGQLIYILVDELGQDIFFPEEDMWLEKIEELTLILEKYKKNKSVTHLTNDELQTMISKMFDEIMWQ